MWLLTACKISVLELDQKWNDFFYRISELMLPTLIHRYEKKEIMSCFIQFKNESLKFYMPLFEEYGSFNNKFTTYKQKKKNNLECTFISSKVCWWQSENRQTIFE